MSAPNDKMMLSTENTIVLMNEMFADSNDQTDSATCAWVNPLARMHIRPIAC
jgi:hypothetical protein